MQIPAQCANKIYPTVLFQALENRNKTPEPMLLHTTRRLRFQGTGFILVRRRGDQMVTFGVKFRSRSLVVRASDVEVYHTYT